MIRERKVLHVDDDPTYARLVQEMLRSDGIDVIWLQDPSQATAALIEHHYGVVLLDIDLGETSGLDLLKEFKTADGSAHVIMLTGLVTMSSVLQSLRRGADECLFKSITDSAALVAAINRAFERIERWWETLRTLSNLRRQSNELLEFIST